MAPYVIRRVVPILFVVLAQFYPSGAGGAQNDPTGSRTLRFGKARELVPKVELDAVGDVVLAKGGGVFLLDLTNYRILALDSSGRENWRTGRRGQGPGEFSLPYRLAVRPNGGVAVLDWGNGRVTLLSATGKVDAILRLPFSFTQIDAMAILADGRYVIAGMTNWGAAGTSDRSLHVFTDSLVYQSSFAPLASALDTASVRYVGSGGFTSNSRGQLLFTPKRPYEIQRYSTDGRMIERVTVKAPLQYDLGDFIAVQRSGKQTLKSTTARTRFVEVPAAVTELPTGGFIGGRGTFERTTVDLISPIGEIEASVLSPAGCVTILLVDTERNVLYCKALRDDVPMLLSVPFRISSGKPLPH
jgi:hypothetical protein